MTVHHPNTAIPEVMQAVLLRGHGGLEQLEFRNDVPTPRPARGEVLIRVGAAAINNTDINTRVGWYSKSVATATAATVADAEARDGGWSGQPFHFPRIQGIDAAGVIVGVGEGIAVDRIGERVVVDPVLRPASGALAGVGYVGAERDGAFAQYMTVPAGNAHRIVSSLTDIELATFPCAYGTAENLLTRAAVARDETVLVTGASGGVGAAAVQLASLRGAHVVALTSRNKMREVAGLGAKSVVDRDASLVESLGRESIDVVIDVVGGTAFASLLDVLKRGGRYAVAGAIAGPIVALDLRTLYLKDLTLLGCTVTPSGVFARLVDLIQSGSLQPLVRAVYPLAEIAIAQSYFLGKAGTGKIVLVP
ncbi:MAG: zinc-binding dehydrogenase [Gammaproteobacteria bacterium]|nr:zinc-binding dehydrogenase [Gammaproteobacteria bacterium]